MNSAAAVSARKGGDSEHPLLVKQIRSSAGRNKVTIAQLESIGLGRIGKSVTLPRNDAVLGTLRKLGHLVEIKQA